MFTQRVKVEFLDGTSQEVVLDQWSVSQWGVYLTRQGLKMDMDDPGPLAVTMTRFQAWAQLHRDTTGPKPSFEVWDRTVAEVEGAEDEAETDPTQTAPSGG